VSTVRVSPGDITFEVEAGETVFDAALRAGWGWPTTCYGQAQCTRCHMKVVAGDSLLAEPDAPERAIIERLARIAYRKEPDVVLRLACQVRPDHDLEVELKQAPVRGAG